MTLIERAPAKTTKVRPDYLALIKLHPLRTIHSQREYDAAVAVVEKLVGFELTKGQEEYLDALGTLIERYDELHHPMPADTRFPLQRLRCLMEQSQTSPAGLGDIIGSRPAASMVLAGKRELSKTHIRKLSAHFKLDAGYFL
jgi:HTH-type transcriptional regulator / antitoxin HigA